MLSCFLKLRRIVGVRGVRTQKPKPLIGVGCSPRFLVHALLRHLASKLLQEHDADRFHDYESFAGKILLVRCRVQSFFLAVTTGPKTDIVLLRADRMPSPSTALGHVFLKAVMLLDGWGSAWALQGCTLDALCQEPGCNRAPQNHSEAKHERTIPIKSKRGPFACWTGQQ